MIFTPVSSAARSVSRVRRALGLRGTTQTVGVKGYDGFTLALIEG
jgi:hypothetical protein